MVQRGRDVPASERGGDGEEERRGEWANELPRTSELVPTLLEAANDLTNETTLDAIRLDHDVSTLRSHLHAAEYHRIKNS